MDGRALYWQYPCDWYHEGRFSKNNYIDDVNKTKKLSKKVLNLIKFAHNVEKNNLCLMLLLVFFYPQFFV